MAAPSGTVWGPIAGDMARLGLYITTSSTATQTTATIDIWLYTKYSVSDSSNTLYYDDQQSNPSTARGSVNVNTTSNNGWNVANQIRIKSGIKITHSRGKSDVNWTFGAKLTGVEYIGATVSVSTTWKAPKLQSYTVKYNANGGSGAPGSQTKWYGSNITLSKTKPTRTGYSFQGWSTANDSSVEYQPGATYSANANLNLYAVWKANTYTVSYNANGGSGAPGSQTKTYGVNLTLSSTKPTRTNYTFKGWGTSPSATTVAYAAGATYSANSSITLYAIWQLAYKAPRLTNLSVDRCNSSGALTESGTYALVKFNWACDRTVSSIKIEYKLSTASSYTSVAVTASGTSGSVSKVIGGSLSTESTYDVRVTVADSGGSISGSSDVTPIAYLIDFRPNGVAVGKPAETDNLFDIGYPMRCRDKLTIPVEHSVGSNVPVAALDANGNVGSNVNMAASDKLSDYPSFVGTAQINSVWYSMFSCRHRNGGGGDGANYGLLIYSPLTSTAALQYRKQYDGNWKSSVTLLDANNYYNYAPLQNISSTDARFRRQNLQNSNGLQVIFLNTDNSIQIENGRRHEGETLNLMGYTVQLNGGSGGVKTNQSIQNVSDQRFKDNIDDIPDKYIEVWKEILPKMFMWNEASESNNDKIQFGLVAQDVIGAFEKHGLNYRDYNFVSSYVKDGEEYFTVSYDHYHMLTALVVRKQQKEIDRLKDSIEKLNDLVLKIIESDR